MKLNLMKLNLLTKTKKLLNFEVSEMKIAQDIILYPIVTEKALKLKEATNSYTFCVVKNTNKIEIKKAVEELFKVKVLSVNIQVRKGKPKRMGRFEGKRVDWKKVICKLKPGDKIELFEGVQ